MNWFPGTVDMSAGLRDTEPTDTPIHDALLAERTDPRREPWRRTVRTASLVLLAVVAVILCAVVTR